LLRGNVPPRRDKLEGRSWRPDRFPCTDISHSADDKPSILTPHANVKPPPGRPRPLSPTTGQAAHRSSPTFLWSQPRFGLGAAVWRVILLTTPSNWRHLVGDRRVARCRLIRRQGCWWNRQSGPWWSRPSATKGLTAK